MFSVYITYIFCISHSNYHNIDFFSTSYLVAFEAALVTPRAVRRVCVWRGERKSTRITQMNFLPCVGYHVLLN